MEVNFGVDARFSGLTLKIWVAARWEAKVVEEGLDFDATVAPMPTFVKSFFKIIVYEAMNIIT